MPSQYVIKLSKKLYFLTVNSCQLMNAYGSLWALISKEYGQAIKYSVKIIQQDSKCIVEFFFKF